MTTKHTEGLYSVKGTTVLKSNGEKLIDFFSPQHNLSYEENLIFAENNAKLFVAAPELLEALINLGKMRQDKSVKDLSDWWHNEAVPAIAKATEGK